MWKTIIIPVGLTIAFWVASALLTTQHLRWLERSERQSMQQDLGSMRAAGQMRYTLRRIDRETLGATRPFSKKTQTELAALEATFLRLLEDARATAVTGEESDLVELIAQRFDEYLRALDLPSPADAAAMARLADQVAEPARRLGEFNERLLRDAALHRSRVSDRMVLVRNALLLVGPAVGLLCGFWISRRLHRSISQISVTLRDVAAEIPEEIGSIRIVQRGDLPHLRQEIDRVVARLREVFAGYTDARQRAIEGARLAAVGEMAAEVAHEIRNPLTSIKLLIQMSGAEQSLTARDRHIMLEEICRIERTVQQLLDLAKPLPGRRSIHEISAILSQALSSVTGRAGLAGVRIEQDIPPGPLSVRGDADQLLQVFGNLVQNAIEASASSPGAVVRIATERTSAGFVRVSVIDVGNGISEAVRERLFEPFVSDKPRGTGLGLAISRRIVEEHGGRLAAGNRTDAPGAVFSVELPLAEGFEHSPAPAADEDALHAQAADHR